MEEGRPLKVVLVGASGRMGQEVTIALGRTSDPVLVAAVSRQFSGNQSRPATPLEAELASRAVRTYPTVESCLNSERPDVLVEFTTAAVASDNLRSALEAGVVPVSGTTGLTCGQLRSIAAVAGASGVGAAVIPNYSLGATVLSILARYAAPYFEGAEIVEKHHDQKRDAPSGTALALARAVASSLRRAAPESTQSPAGPLVAAGRDTISGGAQAAPLEPRNNPASVGGQSSRGLSVDGVRVHSVRLSGLVAHHELIFASNGETLSLRHDSVSRASFMPGLLMTVRQAPKIRGVVTSLEDILVLAGLVPADEEPGQPGL